MENLKCHVLLLVFALVAAVNSQSYPRFEFRGDVVVNNSYILRLNIGESYNYSLHCVTDNSDCCSNGEGNWYDVTGGEVQQGPVGNSSLYVTRGDGVVYLNRRTGGRSGMWRCGIPGSNGEQWSIYIYLGTPTTGELVVFVVFLIVICWKCAQVNCLQQPSTSLWSLANEDPPEFTLTCQSRGGPVTEVEWRRDEVRVEEDSNHMTSQIIVDTSRNTVYNNTLRVRGRESGRYVCTVRN